MKPTEMKFTAEEAAKIEDAISNAINSLGRSPANVKYAGGGLFEITKLPKPKLVIATKPQTTLVMVKPTLKQGITNPNQNVVVICNDHEIYVNNVRVSFHDMDAHDGFLKAWKMTNGFKVGTELIPDYSGVTALTLLHPIMILDDATVKIEFHSGGFDLRVFEHPDLKNVGNSVLLVFNNEEDTQKEYLRQSLRSEGNIDGEVTEGIDLEVLPVLIDGWLVLKYLNHS
jgi:hypothetical protein